jgi:hypothetical protein
MELCLTQNQFQRTLLHTIYLQYVHLNLAWTFKHSFLFSISDQYVPRISHFGLMFHFPLTSASLIESRRKGGYI